MEMMLSVTCLILHFEKLLRFKSGLRLMEDVLNEHTPLVQQCPGHVDIHCSFTLTAELTLERGKHYPSSDVILQRPVLLKWLYYCCVLQLGV